MILRTENLGPRAASARCACALAWAFGLIVGAACGGGTSSDQENGVLVDSGKSGEVASAEAAGAGKAALAVADSPKSAAASGSAAASAGHAGAADVPVQRAAAAAGSGSPVSSPAAAAGGGAAPASPAAGGGAAGAAAPSGENAAAAPAAGSGASDPGVPEMTAAAASGGSEPASCKGDQPGNAPVIYVIGDSTASVYDEKLYPRMGWAQPLQEYFKKACATVQDKALSGRSSKSFFDEGAWTPIRAALHEGDFVLIQFGHNDEKSDDPARYTEPFGSYQKQLTVYIDDTLAAKATPILLTSIERNKWSSGKLSATHGDYPEAVRQLAQKRQLTLVDMTQLTHDYLQRIGEPAADKLFLDLAPGESPNYPNGNSDDTHLQDKGAHTFAEIALADFARQRTPLAALLDHVLTAP